MILSGRYEGKFRLECFNLFLGRQQFLTSRIFSTLTLLERHFLLLILGRLEHIHHVGLYFGPFLLRHRGYRQVVYPGKNILQFLWCLVGEGGVDSCRACCLIVQVQLLDCFVGTLEILLECLAFLGSQY